MRYAFVICPETKKKIEGKEKKTWGMSFSKADVDYVIDKIFIIIFKEMINLCLYFIHVGVAGVSTSFYKVNTQIIIT